MNWTKEQPTKEGCSWQRDQSEEVNIVYVREYGSVMCTISWAIPKDSEWAGPLEEPINEV